MHRTKRHCQGKPCRVLQECPRQNKFSPAAHETEQNRDRQSWHGKRHDDPEKCGGDAAAIDECCFLQFFWYRIKIALQIPNGEPVSYTHLRAHETRHDLVCRLLLEKKKNNH